MHSEILFYNLMSYKGIFIMQVWIFADAGKVQFLLYIELIILEKHADIFGNLQNIDSNIMVYRDGMHLNCTLEKYVDHMHIFFVYIGKIGVLFADSLSTHTHSLGAYHHSR